MAISRLTLQDAQNRAATSSVTATYAATATANDLLIAAVVGNGTIVTPSGWTLMKNGTSNAAEKMAVFYKLSAGSETGLTVSATGASLMSLDIFEFTGNANPITIDGTPTTVDNGSTGHTTVSTASITTTNANDLIFTMIASNGVFGSFAWTKATVIGSNNLASNFTVICGQNIVSATQSGYTDTATWTGSNTTGSIIGAFQASGGGGPTPATDPSMWQQPTNQPWLGKPIIETY